MWWRDGVIYQIYLRSFYDTNGDGVGDIAGVIAKLDYLAELGVNALWLSPVGVSANHDWGYDVTDYYQIDPALGTMSDLEALIAAAKERKIHVLLDLVPNHTSVEHPWFREARSRRDNPKRHWYIWGDPKPGRRPPNNWRSSFGGSAWTYDEMTGQYYLHNFLPQQADLNWDNPEVRAEFKRLMRYWFDRGVAGFRIDVVNMLSKDEARHNNPRAQASDSRDIRLLGQEPIHSGNGPDVHEIIRDWRQLAEGYRQPRLLLGETMVYSAKRLASYYGDDDELQLGFNFPFWQAPFRVNTLRRIVAQVEEALPFDAWPAWAVSNHDNSRMATRWAGGNEAKLRLGLLLLLTLRGTPVLYYGEELGQPDVHVPRWRYRDVVGKHLWPFFPGRDRERTPMVWDDGPNGGFTSETAEPWLPLGKLRRNVAEQRQRHNSTFDFTRRLIALRRASDDLRRGDYLNLAPGRHAAPIWAYQRGKQTIVVLNLSGRQQPFEARGPAQQLFSTAGPQAVKSGAPQAVWQLGPWEGVILRLSSASA